MPANSQFENVKSFMSLYGQNIPPSPVIPSKEVELLRIKLLMEEVLELADAAGITIECSKIDYKIKSNKDLTFEKTGVTDLTKIADGLADIDYVCLGACAAYGFEMSDLQKEVHSSNMTKLFSAKELLDKPAAWHAHETDAKGDKRYIVWTDTGKVAKSPSYRPANFEQFVPKKVQAELF